MYVYMWLFLISILHQTATMNLAQIEIESCSLSVFYIKPQLVEGNGDGEDRCSLSVFYIKPQLNKNTYSCIKSCSLSVFYIKPQHARCSRKDQTVVPYQYSTSNRNREADSMLGRFVVPYQYSTSNRNRAECLCAVLGVVPYQYSTSNRNMDMDSAMNYLVVPYQYSTSNRNCSIFFIVL